MQDQNYNLADKIDSCGDPALPENKKNWKALFRAGIPDQHKRQVILFYFGLTQLEAKKTYELVKE